MSGFLRAIHGDTRGVTLTELLVGTLIGAMIMAVVGTTIFTTNSLRQRADDRSQFASDLSVASLSFDRDGVMATFGALAAMPTASTSCATAMDLGFLEGGASVRYRTVSGRLERVSGSATRTIARNVSSCVFQRVLVGTRYTITMTLGLTGLSGETLPNQVLRAAPRWWL